MSEKNKGLCTLYLGNFKAFAETQQIPIRPLTFIYGANSAGKTSIIHSLLLANHALNEDQIDIHETRLGGNFLDLGGFKQYVHNHDDKRFFEWGIDIEHEVFESIEYYHKETSPIGFKGYIKGFRRSGIRFQIGISDPVAKIRPFNTSPQIRAFTLLLDGIEVLQMARREDGYLHISRLNFKHPVLETAVDGLLVDEASRSFIRCTEDTIDGDQTKISQKKEKLIGRLEKIRALIQTDLAIVPFSTANLLPLGRVPDGVDDYAYSFPHTDACNIAEALKSDDSYRAIFKYIRILRFEFERLFRDFISQKFSIVLKGITYLGPLRCYPPRHFVGVQSQDPNWLPSGGPAWETLSKDAHVRKAVNHWLTDPDHLAKGYELVVRQLTDLTNIQASLQAEIENALGRLTGKPEASITSEAESIVAKLAKTHPNQFLTEVLLQDIKTKVEVSHRDVGQGISQVLPILVSAYGLKDQLIAIEQPELHLHPALQAELADVFIESALGELQNKFLIESHSEYLLLRIMRRMRQTKDGTLPDGKRPVNPEDVAILYVEPVGTRSIVREMPLNERGELIKDWPGGFFEEGLREVLM